MERQDRLHSLWQQLNRHRDAYTNSNEEGDDDDDECIFSVSEEEGLQEEELHDEEDCWETDDYDFNIEEVLGQPNATAEMELTLTQEQRHCDSWVWKVYMLVAFMMAFTSLSQECATLFHPLSFLCWLR